jgi:hypothetical protein
LHLAIDALNDLHASADNRGVDHAAIFTRLASFGVQAFPWTG